MTLEKIKVTAISILLILLPISSSLCIDMYLPAYSSMAKTFNIAEGAINLSMSIYLLGLAIGQLVYGSLADRFGRKWVLIIGLIIFVIASSTCIISSSFTMFLYARFFQALGACSSIVLCRTIVTDSYHPEKRTIILSLISAANIFSPAIAPLLGGFIIEILNWRYIFGIITIFGAAAVVFSILLLNESLTTPDINALKLSKIINNLQKLFTNRKYIGYVLCLSSLYSLVFVWVTFSPTILIDHFAVKPNNFGFYFLLPSIGSTLGAIFTATFNNKLPPKTFIGIGLLLIFMAVFSLNLIVLNQCDSSPLNIVCCIVMAFFGTGMISPHLVSESLSQFVNIGGFASGIMGFIQIISGSSMGTITSLYFSDSEHMLPILMAIALFLALIWFLIATTHLKTTQVIPLEQRRMPILFSQARWLAKMVNRLRKDAPKVKKNN